MSHQNTTETINLYKKLFLILVIITGVGIGITFLHIPPVIAIGLALAIIVVKSGIVYKTFKPLLNGKYSLIILFGLTIIFFIALLLLPAFNANNHLTGTVDISKQYALENPPQEHHGAAHSEKAEEKTAEKTEEPASGH